MEVENDLFLALPETGRDLAAWCFVLFMVVAIETIGKSALFSDFLQIPQDVRSGRTFAGKLIKFMCYILLCNAVISCILHAACVLAH